MPYIILINSIVFLCFLKFDLSFLLHPIPLFIFIIITLLYVVAMIYHGLYFVSIKLSAVYSCTMKAMSKKEITQQELDSCNIMIDSEFDQFTISLHMMAGCGLFTAIYAYAYTMQLIQNIVTTTN